MASFADTYGWIRLCREEVEHPQFGPVTMRRLGEAYDEHVARQQDRQAQGLAVAGDAAAVADGPAENERRRAAERCGMNVAEQRMDALAKANAVRFERARLKRDLKAGALTASRLLDAGPVPAVLESMTVGDLLLCLPRGRPPQGDR